MTCAHPCHAEHDRAVCPACGSWLGPLDPPRPRRRRAAAPTTPIDFDLSDAVASRMLSLTPLHDGRERVVYRWPDHSAFADEETKP